MNYRWNSTGYSGLLFVLALSCLYVWFSFGYQFIVGKTSFWTAEAEDITQYVAGFNMYFSSPWTFPLLAFDSLNYPEGTRVTFVDAIPLYTLILKIFLPASLAPFNPFGVWVALCFILQGVGAWWIAKELRTNSWWFLIALTVLFLFYPALMARLGHISLMSHWILLFAIALYIRTYRLQALPIAVWTIFIVASFHINIYLFVMASGIYLAALLSIKPLRVRNVAVFIIPYLFLAVSLFILVLPLPSGGVAKDSGFGYYSMNLLGPFIGGRIIDVNAAVMDGQYEGFNYLGLGVIIAFFTAYIVQRRSNSGFMRHHWPLICLLIGYSLYSLSNLVYFGQQLIMTVRYPIQLEPLFTQFRASGRFFWPVGYSVIICSFLLLYRFLPGRAFGSVVFLLLFIQIIDVSKHYQTLKFKVNAPNPAIINYSAWDDILGETTKVLYFYPKFRCVRDLHPTLLPVMKYAATNNLKLNTGYISRYKPECDDISQEIAASSRADSAYVFVKEQFNDMAALSENFPIDNPPICQEADFAYICR